MVSVVFVVSAGRNSDCNRLLSSDKHEKYCDCEGEVLSSKSRSLVRFHLIAGRPSDSESANKRPLHERSARSKVKHVDVRLWRVANKST